MENNTVENDTIVFEHDGGNSALAVLAVDDAPVILKVISSVLSAENNYKVFTLSDPKLVEKFLQQITPEVILLDYQMPDINGFELIPIIRSFEKHKNTPIIFLTSKNEADFVAEAVKMGVCDFIIKPIKGILLREKVMKHIKKKA